MTRVAYIRDAMVLTELRAKIKQWEHEYEQQKGHKPDAMDIKADRNVYELYKTYKSAKNGLKRQDKRSAMDAKKGSDRSNASAAETEDGDKSEIETPQKSPPKIMFMTPQLGGKVLSLFDVQISPTPIRPATNGIAQSHSSSIAASDVLNTPSKSSPATAKLHQPQSTPQRTPQRLTMAETPQSQRTPSYLLQRTSLFRGQNSLQDSPIRPKRTGRVKNVSQIIHEAASLRLGLEDKPDSGVDTSIIEILPENLKAAPDRGDLVTSPPDLSDQTQSEAHEAGEGLGLNANTPANQAPRTRKGPKRQTRRVVMRPVASSDVAKGGHASDNYRRMAIHKKGNPRFKRR